MRTLHAIDCDQREGAVDRTNLRVLGGDPAEVQAIDGSFALVAVDGVTVRMARSLDRPMRYFLAKRHEGPALFVADRIDTLQRALDDVGFGNQFHPSYTRMVPAHHIVELALVGCPDPDPLYTRFFTPARGTLPPDLDEIGRRYIGALADEIGKWLCGSSASRAASRSASVSPAASTAARSFSSPTGRCCGWACRRRGSRRSCSISARARTWSRRAPFSTNPGSGCFSKRFPDVPAISMSSRRCACSRTTSRSTSNAPRWGWPVQGHSRALPRLALSADGDGGDENLKDYPIEENPELTIRSVVDNLMLYQEGWGVGRIKHSLTYSGGLSRGYVRTYAPATTYGFAGFSPYTRPDVIEVAEGIPFAALTGYDVPTLYSLKGEIVRRGVKAVTGLDMPVFPKRRFQHGAIPVETMRHRLGRSERDYRHAFERMYA